MGTFVIVILFHPALTLQDGYAHSADTETESGERHTQGPAVSGTVRLPLPQPPVWSGSNPLPSQPPSSFRQGEGVPREAGSGGRGREWGFVGGVLPPRVG